MAGRRWECVTCWDRLNYAYINQLPTLPCPDKAEQKKKLARRGSRRQVNLVPGARGSTRTCRCLPRAPPISSVAETGHESGVPVDAGLLGSDV